MSLLQEALKRKEHDESQRQPEAVSAEKVSSASLVEDANLSAAGQQAAEVKNTGIAQDSPPQSMPVAEQTQAAVIHRKMSFLWIIVAVIAVFFGLIITGGTAFLFYRGLSPAKAKTVQQAEHINKTAAIVAGATNISAGQLVAAPKPESASLAETTANQSVTAAAKNEPTTAMAQTQITAVAQNAEANSVQQQSVGNVESKPTPAKSSFFKPKIFSTVSQSAKWPALKLTGILRGTGKTESTAFINGRMIGAGQTIADVTIVEIQADGVILKYGDEKRFLRVGATSY